jgi:hypothetical protein
LTREELPLRKLKEIERLEKQQKLRLKLLWLLDSRQKPEQRLKDWPDSQRKMLQKDKKRKVKSIMISKKLK